MSDSTLLTVEKALKILELLAEQSMLSVQIQKELNYNKSTVHRLLKTLEERGFVEKNEITNQYHIGLKLVEIASIRLNNMELKIEASPFIRALVNKIKQPAQIAIYDNGEAIFIEKIQEYHHMRMYSQIGKRIPIYCSSVGKALVLNRRDNEILEVLNKQEMISFTKTTLTEPQKVLDEIRMARKTGYTIDNEEHEEGIFCIAAPIFDYRGQIIAAISTAGTNNTFLHDSNAEIINDIKETAKQISARMGYFDK